MLTNVFPRKGFGKEQLTTRSTACLLVVLFVSVLALSSCRSEDEGQALGLDRELAALLPPDVSGVGGVDMMRLKATPVYRLWEESPRERTSSSRFRPHGGRDWLRPAAGSRPGDGRLVG